MSPAKTSLSSCTGIFFNRAAPAAEPGGRKEGQALRKGQVAVEPVDHKANQRQRQDDGDAGGVRPAGLQALFLQQRHRQNAAPRAEKAAQQPDAKTEPEKQGASPLPNFAS